MNSEQAAELIGQVRELARGPFRERAEQADATGTLPKENYAELSQLGIPGLLLPETFGGLEADGATFLKVIEEIAYGDASTAVVVNMHILLAAFINALPPFAHRDEVLRACAAGDWICGPGSIPSRELDNTTTGFRAVEDGSDLVISGRGGFGSGADNARFVFLGGVIPKESGSDLVIACPELDNPAITNRGNWNAMGLRSTASNDVVVEDLRIPRSDCMVVPLSMVEVAQQMMPQPQFQRRATPGFGILAIWLGASKAMFDETVGYLKKRRGYLGTAGTPFGGSTETRDRQAWAQMELGEMDGWIGSGEVMLAHAQQQVEIPYPDRQSFTRMQVRTTYHLRRMSEEVARLGLSTTGAHAYVKGSLLERLYRDLTGGNVMAWKTGELRQSLGLAALGEPIVIAGPAGT